MTVGTDLLQKHIATLVADPAEWRTLIADDLVREELTAILLRNSPRG